VLGEAEQLRVCPLVRQQWGTIVTCRELSKDALRLVLSDKAIEELLEIAYRRRSARQILTRGSFGGLIEKAHRLQALSQRGGGQKRHAYISKHIEQ